MTRGRLNIRPISEADRRLHRGLLASIPGTSDAIALSYGTDPHALDGVLVKVSHTGTYAIWRGLALEQISQRKAAAAIARLPHEGKAMSDVRDKDFPRDTKPEIPGVLTLS